MDTRTILKSLRIENFGCFRDRKIEFDYGINQIIGPNESGKSTIVKALLTVLFEDGATRKKAVASNSNWESDRSFRLTLEFSVSDKTFNLIRDYQNGRDIMTDSDGLIYEGKVIGEKISKYFGVGDRSLFESMFCFSSDHPAAPESSRAKLQSALETPVFYGFDRSRADRYLDDEIKKLENPRAHGPRELDEVTDQISARLQEKSEIEKRLEAVQKDLRELEEIRTQTNEHDQRIAGLEKEIEGAAAYQEVNGRMGSLEERLHVHLGNYSRAAQVTEDLARIETELNRLEVPDTDEMDRISVKGEELKIQVDESKQAMDILIARRKKANRGFIWASLMLVMLCLAYITVQNGVVQVGAAADFLPYSIPLMAVVWLSRMGVYLSQFYRKKKSTMAFRSCVTALDEFYAELNEKYHQQAADPVRALEETRQRVQALQISAENLRNTIEALSEGKGLEHLTRMREQIEGEVAQINRELAPLTPFAASSHKLPNLKEEIISRRVRANALRERAAHLSERCAILDSLKNSLSKVEGQVEILKRKHKDLTERFEILKITRLALNRAADKLIEDTFEAFSASTSTFLESLTNGRYNQLRFNRDPGRFEVKIASTDRWLEVTEALSSSTRDCIYLALRMGGVALLSAEFAPPIILDQAETRMDSERQNGFFDLIHKIMAMRQIIYIGLNKAESVAGARVIELGQNEPAATTSSLV